MPYSDKFTTRGSSFTSKYSSRGTSPSDAYSLRVGYLQKEDDFYLLLETGGRIVVTGATTSDKYSSRSN